MVSIARDYESAILARVILPEEPTMSRAAAEEILKLSFSVFDRQRMSELASKARAGELTPDEQAEAAGYERVSSLLGYLKSKARVSLGRPNGQ